MKNKYLEDFHALSQSVRNSAIATFILTHKRTLAIIVIVAFLLFFGYYIALHPDILKNVIKVGPARGSLIFVLYFGVVLTNCGIMYNTIRLCKKTLPLKSGLLLTMYTSVINFFGPLQSGPGVRAVYLKTKIGLRIRDYTYAMLFYYFSFAALNASLLFINKMPWFTLIGVIAAITLTIVGTYKFGLWKNKRFVIAIFVLTLIQILFMVIIYGTELNVVDPSAHYSIFQMISYTSSANLSLFVSLTPGGIGIREAFLIFAGSLHNVSLSSIVAAGILDRAIYIFFLIILFVISSIVHIQDTLGVSRKKLSKTT
jgi:uncharacterized membrane protein YbhN (UPF0104 family)